MPSLPLTSRIDTLELKAQIFKKLGRQKAEKYFYNLNRLLNLKLSKLEFKKLLYSIIGKENLTLHNLFIESILSNACLSHCPPSKQMTTGHSWNTKMSNGFSGDMLPKSPRKGRSVSNRDRRLIDRPRPLEPQGKIPNGHIQEITNSCDLRQSREQQSAPELISIGSKALLEVASVEDGEEVEQVRDSPGVQSRSPVTAPFGLKFCSLPRKALNTDSTTAFSVSKSFASGVCLTNYDLPDTRALKKHLETKFQQQGLGVSLDCVNLLNHGLDAYLKRLIRPCVDLTRSRCSNTGMNQPNGDFSSNMSDACHELHVQTARQFHTVSLLDFRLAMESNHQLVGGDWPVQLEKICALMH